jgi:CheY-like chemotaxis protein
MNLRVLIVEDNPQNLELMCFLLESAGHSALTARNGLEGLTKSERENPDLIICDLQMPGLDGFGMLERVRANPRLRAIPCVAVTALAMPSDRDRVMTSGFCGYVSKPIEPRTFVGLLESLWSGARDGNVVRNGG